MQIIAKLHFVLGADILWIKVFDYIKSWMYTHKWKF